MGIQPLELLSMCWRGLTAGRTSFLLYCLSREIHRDVLAPPFLAVQGMDSKFLKELVAERAGCYRMCRRHIYNQMKVSKEVWGIPLTSTAMETEKVSRV